MDSLGQITLQINFFATQLKNIHYLGNILFLCLWKGLLIINPKKAGAYPSDCPTSIKEFTT